MGNNPQHDDMERPEDKSKQSQQPGQGTSTPQRQSDDQRSNPDHREDQNREDQKRSSQKSQTQND